MRFVGNNDVKRALLDDSNLPQQHLVADDQYWEHLRCLRQTWLVIITVFHVRMIDILISCVAKRHFLEHRLVPLSFVSHF